MTDLTDIHAGTTQYLTQLGARFDALQARTINIGNKQPNERIISQ